MLFFSHETPSISTVIPAMDHIDKYLVTTSLNLKYSEAIHAALALGKQTLNWYYDKTDHSKVYRISMGKPPCCLFYIFSSSLFLQFSTLDTNYTILGKPNVMARKYWNMQVMVPQGTVSGVWMLDIIKMVGICLSVYQKLGRGRLER